MGLTSHDRHLTVHHRDHMSVTPTHSYFFFTVGVVVNQCTVGVDERTNGLANKIICVLTFWHQYLHVVLSQAQGIHGVDKDGMSNIEKHETTSRLVCTVARIRR